MSAGPSTIAVTNSFASDLFMKSIAESLRVPNLITYGETTTLWKHKRCNLTSKLASALLGVNGRPDHN